MCTKVIKARLLRIVENLFSIGNSCLSPQFALGGRQDICVFYVNSVSSVSPRSTVSLVDAVFLMKFYSICTAAIVAQSCGEQSSY
jgi:hypothetical protein